MAGAEILLAVAGLSKASPVSPSSFAYSPYDAALSSHNPSPNPHNEQERGRLRTLKPLAPAPAASPSGHALLDLLQHACTPSARFSLRRKKSPAASRSSSRHRKHASFDMDRSRGTTYAPATWSSTHLRNARKSMVDSCGTSKAFNARNQHRLLSLSVSQHYAHGKTHRVAERRMAVQYDVRTKGSRSERENSQYLRIVTLERIMYCSGKLSKIPTLGKCVLRKRADDPCTPGRGSSLRYGWTADDSDDDDSDNEQKVHLLDVIQ